MGLIPFLLDKTLRNSPFPAILCTSESLFAAGCSVKFCAVSLNSELKFLVYFCPQHGIFSMTFPFPLTVNKKSTSREQWRG